MGSEVAKRKCMGDDCENDAGSLQCPTCLKLDIKDSYFCSQDCFKRNWVSYPESHIVWSPKARRGMRSTGSGSATCYSPLANNLQGTHKALHKSNSNFLHNFITPKVVSEPDPETGLFNPFPTFPYTGPLRPVYPLSERRTVPKSIPYPDYALDGIPHSERTPSRRNKIQILDKKGQEGMRKVCRLAREVLDLAAAAVRPGVTTDYIDEIVHKACIERNVSV